MSRSLLLTLFAAGALGLSGCRSVPADTTADAYAIPGAALESSRNEPGVLDYAMVLPENVAYVPWKMIGGLGRGIVDGGAAGFEPQRLPLLGLLFLPVNVAVGGVTGLVTGTVSKPGFIGPRDNFGSTMGLATKRPTPIWWLPE